MFVHSSVRSNPVVPSCTALSASCIHQSTRNAQAPVDGKSGHTALSSCFHNSARIIHPSLRTVYAHCRLLLQTGAPTLGSIPCDEAAPDLWLYPVTMLRSAHDQLPAWRTRIPLSLKADTHQIVGSESNNGAVASKNVKKSAANSHQSRCWLYPNKHVLLQSVQGRHRKLQTAAV